eukprot:1158282-Prymnesium_polylepis.1
MRPCACASRWACDAHACVLILDRQVEEEGEGAAGGGGGSRRALDAHRPAALRAAAARRFVQEGRPQLHAVGRVDQVLHGVALAVVRRIAVPLQRILLALVAERTVRPRSRAARRPHQPGHQPRRCRARAQAHVDAGTVRAPPHRLVMLGRKVIEAFEGEELADGWCLRWVRRRVGSLRRASAGLVRQPRVRGDGDGGDKQRSREDADAA